MVYVDLNPIRAGLAATPEESDFTSVQERIRAWKRETPSQESVSENIKHASSKLVSQEVVGSNSSWLCPISSDTHKRGILQMSALDYFDLVDKSGRIVRSDKRGAIDSDLAPILARIGASSKAWLDTISDFGSRFCLAAGSPANLRRFAAQLCRRWIRGIGIARTAFAPSLT